MKVVILHYHLNPGGVTSIIGSQVKALQSLNQNLNILILCGNNSTGALIPGVEIISNEMLNYDLLVESVNQRTSAIAGIIKKHLSKESILHCHNANLGKNPALTAAVHSLAIEGYKIVNHCHDFAEDRPVNLDMLEKLTGMRGPDLRSFLYPDLPNYHFGVLNSCDYNRLHSYGIALRNLHLLYNPVSVKVPGTMHLADTKRKICRELDIDPTKKVITYPVRGIRRKNLGELVLMAILFEKQSVFVVTQAPRNIAELPVYNRWKEFCINNQVNVKFEAGEKVSHEELIGISDFCITTSIREGFGMVFLEPWLAGVAVAGRELPCITNDLKAKGIILPLLYKEINIISPSGSGDFKDLEINEQEDYLKTLRKPGAREELIRMNPFLSSLFTQVASKIIETNKNSIQKFFSVSQYGKRLFTIYQEIPG